MRAFASSLHSWASIEGNTGTSGRHGLTFPLAVVGAIGEPHGLELVDEDEAGGSPEGFDAVFLSIMDSRILMGAARHFRRWGLPFRRADRRPSDPLVWAGGQGIYNPMPLADVADLIVVGDAEEPLPTLLALWDRHQERGLFLSEAATVPGVFVPSLHDPRRDRVTQAVSPDISVTLRESVDVSLAGQRRIEIARGCRSKCLFCGLGWHGPLRCNNTDEVVAAVEASPRLVHLQAGDAEGHPGIGTIRAAMASRGSRDAGWTGRLDTTQESDDTIPGGKRYAFGVEGVSQRLRRAVGKARLTNARLVEDTAAFLRRIEPGSVGRAAWHLIAGLPTQRPEEVLDLLRVLRAINDRIAGQRHRALTLHWQPFQPLPGTPMQWYAAGRGCADLAAFVRPLETLPWLRIRQHTGRTDDVARLCTVLSRSDRRGADLLEAIDSEAVDTADAARIAGVGWGELDPDAPLPWDFIDHWTPRDRLRRGFDAFRRLSDPR